MLTEKIPNWLQGYIENIGNRLRVTGESFQDVDGDTAIQVEKTDDEDVVRIKANGTEIITFDET